MKKYKTKSGYPVTIYEWNGRGNYPVIGIIHKVDIDFPCQWTEKFEYRKNDESNFDLVEVNPYEDFNIDDKVYVWNNGATSWSSNGEKTTWVFCEKAEE